MISVSMLWLAACGGDDSASDGAVGVEGLWAWCDDDACTVLDDGGLFFTEGRVFDAWYNAQTSQYCTYELIGTYGMDGDDVLISYPSIDRGESYMLDGSLLRGPSDLKRVRATLAPSASCPN